MCQIIYGSSAQVKNVLLNTVGLIEQLHKNNPDGWGALYHTTKGVKAIKKLPKTAVDTRNYIKDLPSDDRIVALHWRMRTSGKIDHHNAHPHHIDGGWLIHNGILDISTKSDPDKCDSIHFCRRYLDGSVSHIVASEKMQNLLGDFIGNNRFVLMDDSGASCVINADQGYMAQNLWFANDYSMDREMVDPTYVSKKYLPMGYKRYTPSTSGHWPVAWADEIPEGSTAYDWRDEYEDEAESELEQGVFDAVHDCDVDMYCAMLESSPASVLTTTFDMYDITPYGRTQDDTLTAAYIRIRELLIDKNTQALVSMIYVGGDTAAAHIAEVLMWYCETTENEFEYAA